MVCETFGTVNRSQRKHCMRTAWFSWAHSRSSTTSVRWTFSGSNVLSVISDVVWMICLARRLKILLALTLNLLSKFRPKPVNCTVLGPIASFITKIRISIQKSNIPQLGVSREDIYLWGMFTWMFASMPWSLGGSGASSKKGRCLSPLNWDSRKGVWLRLEREMNAMQRRKKRSEQVHYDDWDKYSHPSQGNSQ